MSPGRTDPSGARGGARTKAVVHVDLDGAEHIFRVHGWKWEQSRDSLFESGLRGCLELFESLSVPATLFVIAEDLDDPGKAPLLEEAVDRGFEIASHTVTHRDLTSLDSEQKRREILESRDRIGERLGEAPDGFRAPQFRFDPECAELLDEAGYRYDSSLFPRSDVTSARPHRLTGGVTELPMPKKLLGLAPFHPSYSLVLGDALFRAGIRKVRNSGAPLVLLFHLTDFAAPLPSDALPNWAAKVFTLSHLSASAKRERCARMLSLVQGCFDVVPTRKLVEEVHD